MTKGFIFDLDGTVYLGDRLIEGAAEAIQNLRKRGDKVIFLTNKSIATRQSYVEKLTRMGIETSIEEVLSSSFILAKYLKKNLAKHEAVFVIGEEALFQELEFAGVRYTTNITKAKYVVIGWDRQFTYEKLNQAYQAFVFGAKFIATNPDRTCPVEEGQIPDCAAMIGALEGATGQPVDLIMGKPSKYMAAAAVNSLGLDYSQCYMVGDRLETDIKMGNDTGMHSVLVLTGTTTTEMAKKSPLKPRYILDSIEQITSI